MLAILNVLRQCGGHKVSEDTIFHQVNCTLAPPATAEVLRDNLRECKEKGFADYTVDQLDGTERYFITDRGDTALR